MTDSIPVKPRADDSASHRRASSSTSPSRIKHRGSEPQIGTVEVDKRKYDSPFDASLAAARKRTQHEKLWDLFAMYALQLSSEDPTRMRIANAIKLLQDCDVIDGSSTDEAKMIEKEVPIVCESFLKSHPSDRNDATSKKLNFTAFLALLSHFAKMSDEKDPSRAYDSLVRTCIERQLKPSSTHENTLSCISHVHATLWKIFGFYASVMHAKLEKLEPKTALASPLHMGYTESVTFGRMYGLIALGGAHDDRVRGDLHRQPAQGARDRVRPRADVPELLGLFQLMWLACASNSPRALKITDVLKTDRVDVMKVFLLHFEKFWRKEHYENYVGNRASSDAFASATRASVDAVSINASTSSSVSPPPSPMSSSRPSMPRRLSLRVQTSPNAKNPDAKRALQRRFSMQPAPTTPPASPPKTAK